MRLLMTVGLMLGIASAATAQTRFETVSPRDVEWYTAHPTTLEQTLRVCHGHAAYMALPDCANAESAGAGLMGRDYRRALRTNNGLNLYDPAYWSANPIARDGILAQCSRRGRDDALALPYCQVASASKLQEMRR